MPTLPLTAPRTLRHAQEGFRETLVLQPDGSFRNRCEYHVINGGQYDEDDHLDTYTGAVRYRLPGLLVLEVLRGRRKVWGSPREHDLTHPPPDLLAFLDVRGDLTELVHAAVPYRGVAPTIEAELAFFAGKQIEDAGACRCKLRDRHVLRVVEDAKDR